MRVLLLMALVGLSACSWFRPKPPVPDPTEFVVTGAPGGSIVFVDGAASAPPNSKNGQPQVIDVAPGPHTVEVHMDDVVVYSEEADAVAHRHTLIKVLSGLNR